MKKQIYLSVLSLFIVMICIAQVKTKVAGYSFGKPGTDEYEHLEFWAKDCQRTDIKYAYGKGRKSVKLLYLDIDQINGNRCFKVRFNNNYVLFIIPDGVLLKVIDANGKYNRAFVWEYEGPVNGIGTFCNICAESDKDAMSLIQNCYMK